MTENVACRFLAHAERFGGFLAVERLALADAVLAVREDEVAFRRFRRFLRQALREESGHAQRPHFVDIESRFVRFVVDFLQFGELVGCVFVFQRVPFLSLSINRLFLQMKASTSIPCCVRVGLPVSTRAFPSLVTVGLLVIRVPERACRFFISPPSSGIRAPKPTVRPRRVGI